MAGYDLQPGEAFVHKADRVLYGGFLASYADELLLTSHNLVLLQKGALGRMALKAAKLDQVVNLSPQQVKVFPLHQIKVFQGHAQALVGKQQNGSPALDVYFHRGTEHFGFESHREAIFWSQKIDEVITGTPATMISPNSSSAAQIAAAVKDTVDIFKQTFGIESKSTVAAVVAVAAVPAQGRCLCCGAPCSGNQGQAVVCSYCGTANQL
ncbi:MAG: hypothetical protein HGB10_03490 [Coriobacteriia bacterium]|nr:hypothetical protein [Coriobacteriia bacterium]